MIKLVNKIWGWEEWVVNNNKYCGKILHIINNHRCSLHYHKIKDETFLIQQGKIFLEIGKMSGEIVYCRLMEKNESHRIPPNTPHRFTAVDGDAIIVEFSTQHKDEDSYRLAAGGKINDV